MVDAGFDADFGKQAKYLKKIEKAPFWGIHKHVRVSALCAGVTVNENYQALRTDGVRDHADVGHEAHQLDALERRLRCAQPFEQVCRTERRLLEHLVRRTDELGDAPVQRVSGRALDAVLHRQVAPFLGFQIVATMCVERERDHVGRAAVLFDFRGYGLLQKLGTGKAQRSVHEIVLIVHYDQQALHALLPSFSACHLFSFPSISA